MHTLELVCSNLPISDQNYAFYREESLPSQTYEYPENKALVFHTVYLGSFENFIHSINHLKYFFYHFKWQLCNIDSGAKSTST